MTSSGHGHAGQDLLREAAIAIRHWRTGNADGRGEYCYTGNSHVKPMMEIIDSAGVLHGWVGVEASINQTSPSQGAMGDDIGVFAIADV